MSRKPLETLMELYDLAEGMLRMRLRRDGRNQAEIEAALDDWRRKDEGSLHLHDDFREVDRSLE